MNPIHLLRMARIARHPPSRNRVLLVAAVVVICLALAGLERLGLAPGGALVDPGGTVPKVRPLP
ncbi:hypothetical protein OEZ60_02610 [Defluviimonas sp. WL0024]|uniref:Uncharacterized protein n=2 Tax=Albidovulum TaxID=205889 RepID=A0ABT3J0E4_9RHOB|nr:MULTISPECIES: hypothetical protein [Defluviimonas]MCU9846886.1 hypothetical protein [Defluviimonas sp. WL0024]MCW3781145.1 hypothetical protein [Defluviimonas salinarum]